MPIGAALGAAAIGGVATVAAGNSAKKAAGQAASAQTASSDQALAVQQQQFQQQRADLEPWRQVGIGALQQLARTYNISVPTGTFNPAPAPGQPGAPAVPGAPALPGSPGLPAATARTPFTPTPFVPTPGSGWVKSALERAAHEKEQSNLAEQHAAAQLATGQDYSVQGPTLDVPTAPAPQTPAAAIPAGTAPAGASGRFDDFFASPDYQFRFAEGQRAVTGNAAARGLIDSGVHGQGLINYGQNVASQEYGSWFQRLSSLAGLGSSATAQGVQAGQASANNQTGIIQNRGDNLASSYATQGGIQAGLISGVGNAAAGVIRNWPQAPPANQSYNPNAPGMAPLQGLY